MKRHQFNSLDNNVVFIPVENVSKDPSKSNEVLKQIFALDPATGLPCNDEAVFLSEKTNPLIKQYIQTQLRQQDKPSSNSFDGITADDLEALTRNCDETRSEYAARVQKYLDGIKSDFNEKLKTASNKPKKVDKEETKTD